MIASFAIALLAGLASFSDLASFFDQDPIRSPSRIPYRPSEPAASCKLPPIDPGTRLIVAGFYEGAGVSTVAVAGQDDKTTAGDIHIEPGRDRLTLVFTGFDPIIYRFSGATRRVARLILVHRDRVGAGVVGLPRARVAFASAEECGLPYSIYERPDLGRTGRARAWLGREPDMIGGAYTLQRATVGAGGVVSPPVRRQQGRPDGFLSDLYHFYPSGVIAIHPREVVASRRPERFRLLPSTAGIVQLLREGALVPATSRDADAWLAAARRLGIYSDQTLRELDGRLRHYALRVVRPIRIPAQLCGAHSVWLFAPSPTFVSGDPCHSEVFFADGTGRGIDLRTNR